MKEQKKILMMITGFVLALLVFFLYDVRDAKAAVPYRAINAETSYNKQKERTVGNTIFEYSDDSLYAIQNTKKQLLISTKNLHSSIMTNGEAVYASAGDPKNDRVTIFYISSFGEKAKKLFSCKTYRGDGFAFKSYCEGKLCYTRTLEEFEGYELWEYAIESGKKKVVTKKDVGYMRAYGGYIYITPYLGDNFFTGSLRMYDMKRGRLKTLCSQSHYFDVKYGSLYYLETLKYDYPKITVSVKKCNLNGGKKKTLVEKMVIGVGEMEFNKKSITYKDVKGKKKNKKYDK